MGARRPGGATRNLLVPMVLIGGAAYGLAVATPPAQDFVIAPAAEPDGDADLERDIGAHIGIRRAGILWMESFFAGECPTIVKRWAGMEQLVKLWPDGRPPVGYAESGVHFHVGPPDKLESIHEHLVAGTYGMDWCRELREKAVPRVEEACIATEASEWAGAIGMLASAPRARAGRTRTHGMHAGPEVTRVRRAGHTAILLELDCAFTDEDVSEWLAYYWALVRYEDSRVKYEQWRKEIEAEIASKTYTSKQERKEALDTAIGELKDKHGDYIGSLVFIPIRPSAPLRASTKAMMLLEFESAQGRTLQLPKMQKALFKIGYKAQVVASIIHIDGGPTDKCALRTRPALSPIRPRFTPRV